MNDRIVFARTDGTPLPQMHHLAMNPRGKFVLKVTISTSPGLVGVQKIIQLRTSDPAVAMDRRDTILEAYKVAGILCRDYQILEM